LQECVERTLLDPKPSDVAEVRRQAEQAVLRAGAVAESVEVRVEIDAARGILRATATGAHELTIEEDSLEEPALRAKASGLMGVEQEQARLAAKTRRFFVYTAERERKAFWGLLKRRCRPWRVLDHRGDVRLGASHGTLISTRAASLMSELSAALERHAGYSDAGRAFPPTFLVTDDRTVDLSGLASEAHVASVCQTELGRLAAEDPVVLALSLPIP
ncbi:MAG: hypothetical protein KGK30_04175, partial [Elusimicrobia bacterium]|nr:hypothetical protein [Elusimicrobiota bacterium]